MMRTRVRRPLWALMTLTALVACGDDGTGPMDDDPLDPATAPRVMVDRFSDAAGNLFQRSANPDLPAAGAHLGALP